MGLRTLSTHKITFYRKGSKSLVDGEYVYTPSKTIGGITGSLQPFSKGIQEGVSSNVLPMGIDSLSAKVFRSKSVLRTYVKGKESEADYCIIDGDEYVAMKAGDWNITGFSTSHYIYILFKRPTKPL